MDTWYKNGYVWLIIVLPLAAVIISFYLLYVSITHADTVVTDGWTKDGVAVYAPKNEKDRITR